MNSKQFLTYQEAAYSVEGCSIATGFIREDEPNILPIQYSYRDGTIYVYRVNLTNDETIKLDLDFSEDRFKAESWKQYEKDQDGWKLKWDIENAWKLERTARLLKEALLETYFELNKEAIITKNIKHFDDWSQSVGGVSGIFREDGETYDENEYSIEYTFDHMGSHYYFIVDLTSPQTIKSSLEFDKDYYVSLIEGAELQGFYEYAKAVIEEAEELSEVSKMLIDTLVHAYDELKKELFN